jgi:Fic family protein
VAPYPPLVYSSETDKDELARARDRGELVRLATGIYTSETDRPIEEVAKRRLWEIVARVMPDAVIVDRSVREGGTGSAGTLYVVAKRRRALSLPGVKIVPRAGAGPQPGDMKLPDGLYMSGFARALLENLAPTRKTAAGTSRTLTREEVEIWINELAARGDGFLNRLRDDARALVPALEAEKAMPTLDALISAALLTNDSIELESTELRARAGGAPMDTQRTEAFTKLAEFLSDQAPDTLPALKEDQDRRSLLPFYEAYFSNYIEGTEFTLDEAAEIVFDDVVPEQRPADAHDIIGTYELTSSLEEMRRVPRNPDEFIELLKARHAVIMAGRPEKGPGQFKERANQAGSTVFVPPSMVEGTLRRGFEIGAGLVSPFSRAVYMMFLTSEVHPFADGNGRIGRIVMNAELETAGEIRIIIPTVYRLNYLSALKAGTQSGHYAALVAALAFARRWTARVNFSSRATAEPDLERTHALRDAREAEEAGIRLVLP